MTHLPNMPELLYCFPESAGKKWMPSNGTEGMIWMAEFCEQCIHEKFMHTQKDNDLKCDIWTRSMVEGEVDEWVYSSKGWPICTKWKFWDWHGGDSGDGLNEPPPPEPFNPRQLIIPYDLVGLLVGYDDFVVSRTYIIERELVEN